jgi:hypothetical protein
LNTIIFLMFSVLTNHSLFFRLVFDHWENRVITIPRDIPKAKINQNPG